MESYRNFMIEDKLRDIIQYVGEFVGEWGNFKEEFQKMGRGLETVSSSYEKLSTTRAKLLDKKIQKIEAHQTVVLPIAASTLKKTEKLLISDTDQSTSNLVE